MRAQVAGRALIRWDDLRADERIFNQSNARWKSRGFRMITPVTHPYARTVHEDGSKDERVEGSSTDKAKHVADQARDQAG